MNVIKKFGLVSILAISSMSSNAELVSGDWLSQGDGLSVLDTDSGVEWLSLTETDNMSILEVQAQLDTTFSGWRLPTRLEVYTMMSNTLPDANTSYENRVWQGTSGSESDLSHWVNSMGINYGTGYSKGLFINDKQSEFGGSEVMYSGVVLGYGVYSNIEEGGLGFKHYSSGVFLVNDGGVSLSSIENPNLNINNPNAPVNNVSASVPVSSSLALLGLALAGMSFRRKEK